MKKYFLIFILSPVTLTSLYSQIKVPFIDKSQIKYQGDINFRHFMGLTTSFKGNNYFSYGNLPSVDRMGVSSLNGLRLNEYIFTGIGVGIDYFLAYKLLPINPLNPLSVIEDGVFAMPLYGNITGYLPVFKDVDIFASVDLGTSIAITKFLTPNNNRVRLKPGLLFNPLFGVNFHITSCHAINLGLGYSMQKWSYKETINSTRQEEFIITPNALQVRFGFTFKINMDTYKGFIDS